MLGVGIWEETPPRRRAVDTGQGNILGEEQDMDPTMLRVFLSAPLAFEKGSAVKTAACGRVLGVLGRGEQQYPSLQGRRVGGAWPRQGSDLQIGVLRVLPAALTSQVRGTSGSVPL